MIRSLFEKFSYFPPLASSKSNNVKYPSMSSLHLQSSLGMCYRYLHDNARGNINIKMAESDIPEFFRSLPPFSSLVMAWETLDGYFG